MFVNYTIRYTTLDTLFAVHTITAPIPTLGGLDDEVNTCIALCSMRGWIYLGCDRGNLLNVIPAEAVCHAL